jgi:hypothetical protein
MFITEYVLLIGYFGYDIWLRYVHNYIFHWTFCECSNQSFDDLFMLWIISRFKKIRSFVYAEYIFRFWARGLSVCVLVLCRGSTKQYTKRSSFFVFYFCSARTTDKRRNFKRLVQQFITTIHFFRLTLLISFIFPNAMSKHSQMFTQLPLWARKFVHPRQETL